MVTVGLLYPGHSAEDDYPGARGTARRRGPASGRDHLRRRGRTPGGRPARPRPRRTTRRRRHAARRRATGRGDVGLHLGQFRLRPRGRPEPGVRCRRRARRPGVVDIDRLRRCVQGPRRAPGRRGRVLPRGRGAALRPVPVRRRRRGGLDGQPRDPHRGRGRHARARAGGRDGQGGRPPGRRGRAGPGHRDAHAGDHRRVGGGRRQAGAHRQPGDRLEGAAAARTGTWPAGLGHARSGDRQ